jgi:ankyrin repeat protein
MANDKTRNNPILGGIGAGPISVVFKHLSSIADWARLSSTCTTLRKLGQQTPHGRVIARQVIPLEVLNHPIFVRYPINWVLLDKLTQRPELLAEYFQDPYDTEWILAALLGLEGAVKELLQDKIGIKLARNDARVGHFFIPGGHKELFRDFSETYPPHLKVKKNYERLSMKFAVSFGQREIVELLVEKPYSYDIHEMVKVNDRRFNLCGLAAISNQGDMLKYLISLGVDPEYGCLRTDAAMFSAWDCYDYLITEQVIKNPLDSENRERIFVCAAGCDREDIFNEMLLPSVDGSLPMLEDIDPTTVMADFMTPLSCAVRNGNIESVKAILKKNWGSIAQVRYDNGKSLLHELIESGNFLLLPQLLALQEQLRLSRKLDLTLCDKKGNTLLHSAALIGDINAFNYFLQAGDYIVAGKLIKELPLTKECITVAQVAASQGQLKFLEHIVILFGKNVLLGVDVNGDTIQHHACRSKNLSLLRWLVKQQGDINLRLLNSQQETPLHILAEQATYEGIANAWYFIAESARQFGVDLLRIPGRNNLTVQHDMCDEAMGAQPWVAYLLGELFDETYRDEASLKCAITKRLYC